MISRLLALLIALPASAIADGGVDIMQFDTYSPMSSANELMHRLFTPLSEEKLRDELERSHKRPAQQSIDLADERFAVHVPRDAPSAGYALLIFVPPWEDAHVPTSWIESLDRHHTIFISAAQSGNQDSVLDRRVPLALLAGTNAMKKWRVDSKHVYVGGFSGGSRVALRIAVAYPDIFRGALLEAGSDPLGSVQVPLPDATLFRDVQTHSRFVFLTGDGDATHADQDTATKRSMQQWCVANVDAIRMPWTGHDVADGAAFERALTSLELTTTTHDDEKCRAHIDAEIAAALSNVESSIRDGKSNAAKDALVKLDARFGGLAAPRSVDLYRQLVPR